MTVYPEDTEVDASRLPQVMAAICETQRIRSIVPVGIPHGCLAVQFLLFLLCKHVPNIQVAE